MILTVTPGVDLSAISGAVTKAQLNLLGQPTVAVQAGSVQAADINIPGLLAALAASSSASNYLRNANFAKTMWQRGTSASPLVGAATFLADYWQCSPAYVAPGSATMTYAREEAGPANGKSLHCAKLTGNTTIAIVDFQQDIGSHLATALRSTLTLQFWLYNATGASLTPLVRIDTADAQDSFTSTTNRYSVAAGAAQTNATWQQYTVTFDATSYTNMTNGMRVIIRFPSGALNSNAKYVRIAQAKLEIGASATLFSVERDEISETIETVAPETGSVGFASNLTLSTSRASSAETIALKTRAGTDPTATDYITLNFRDAAATTGGYVSRTITAATSLTIPSTAHLGTGVSSVITVTIAVPGVVTYADHKMRPDDTFVLSTTGALPTGLTAGTTYYVARTGYTASTFQISTTAGGAAITTTGSQSGIHTLAQTPKPFRLWLVAGDDSGTVRLGVVRCDLGSGSIMALRNDGIYSSTILNTSSNSSGVIYSTVAWTSKAIRVLGYFDYTTLGVAGTWNAAPTFVQIFGAGVKLPGDMVQVQRSIAETFATTTTTMAVLDVVPPNTEGAQFMSQAITPTAAANRLRIRHGAGYLNSTNNGACALAVFRDAETLAAQSVIWNQANAATTLMQSIDADMLAGSVAATTIKVRAGSSVAGTFTFNGDTGARRHGGKLQALLEILEIMT